MCMFTGRRYYSMYPVQQLSDRPRSVRTVKLLSLVVMMALYGDGTTPVNPEIG